MAYFVVIEHAHDTAAGVYRLVVARAEDVEQPMVDEKGQAIVDDDDQVMTETVAVAVGPTTDFVWADDDDRWKDKDDEAIAKLQRNQIKRHLAKLEREQADLEAQAAAQTKPLTDGGEKL